MNDGLWTVEGFVSSFKFHSLVKMNCKTIVLLSFTLISCIAQAQREETVDSLFNQFIHTEFFQQVTDTLPDLFKTDSTTWQVEDLTMLQSITQDSTNLPVYLNFREWKLIRWKEIPPRTINRVIEVRSEEKCFGKYEIQILIPLIKPDGQSSSPDHCCDDSHYSLWAKYIIKETRSGFEIRESYQGIRVNRYCVYFL